MLEQVRLRLYSCFKYCCDYSTNNMNMPRPIPIIGTASVSPIIMKNLDCRNGASSGCLAIPSINLLPKIPTHFGISYE